MRILNDKWLNILVTISIVAFFVELAVSDASVASQAAVAVEIAVFSLFLARLAILLWRGYKAQKAGEPVAETPESDRQFAVEMAVGIACFIIFMIVTVPAPPYIGISGIVLTAGIILITIVHFIRKRRKQTEKA